MGAGSAGVQAQEAPPRPPRARPRPLPAAPPPRGCAASARRSAHRRACGPAWRGKGTPPPRGSTPQSPRQGWWPPPPAPCRPPRRRRPPQPPPWPGRPATSPRRELARPRAPRRRTPRGGRALGGFALGLARGACAGAAEGWIAAPPGGPVPRRSAVRVRITGRSGFGERDGNALN